MAVNLTCPNCGTQTLIHCTKTRCEWRRCPRCHSYGTIGAKWQLYDKGAAYSMYNLTDIQTIDPTRLPATRKAIAGYSD